MSKVRNATIDDFIIPEFRDKDPKDYEIRNDGKCVRKDRWEMGIQRIREIVGIKSNADWEIKDIVSRVDELSSNNRWQYPRCDLCDVTFDKESMGDCHHFSGVIEREYNNHIHVCSDCCDKYDLSVTFDFDNVLNASSS